MSHTSLCSSGIQPSCPNWEGQTSPCEEINRGPLDMILANSVAEVPADNQHQHPDRYLQMIPVPSCWVNPPFLECHIPGLLWFLAFSDWFLSVSHMLWRCLYVLLWFNLSLSFFFFITKTLLLRQNFSSGQKWSSTTVLPYPQNTVQGP